MPTLEEQLLGRIDLNQLGKGTSLSADFAVQKSHSSAALSPRSLSADNSENRDSARESSSLPSLTKSLGVDSPKKAKSPRSKSRKKITIDTEKIDGTKKEVRIDSPRKEVKIDSPRKRKKKSKSNRQERKATILPKIAKATTNSIVREQMQRLTALETANLTPKLTARAKRTVTLIIAAVHR